MLRQTIVMNIKSAEMAVDDKKYILHKQVQVHLLSSTVL